MISLAGTGSLEVMSYGRVGLTDTNMRVAMGEFTLLGGAGSIGI